MDTPYTMCQQYAAYEIDRETLREFLVSWKYAPSDFTNGINTLLIELPGSWEEVERAHTQGLIDDCIYDEVLDEIAMK